MRMDASSGLRALRRLSPCAAPCLTPDDTHIEPDRQDRVRRHPGARDGRRGADNGYYGVTLYTRPGWLVSPTWPTYSEPPWTPRPTVGPAKPLATVLSAPPPSGIETT